MFDKITFTNQSGSDSSFPIDIGKIVESMIFYRTAYVVADKRILSCLISFFGIENLLALIGNNNLVIYYCESMLVLESKEVFGRTYHKPMYLNAPIIDFEYVVDEIFGRLNLRENNITNSKNRIIESIDIYDKSSAISSLANKAFSNDDFILGAAKTIISKHMVVGANLNDIKMRVIPTELGSVIETNIDFTSSIFHEKTTEASILNRVLSVEWALEVAGKFNSSLVSNGLDSKICCQKVNSLTQVSALRESNVSNFISCTLTSEKDIQYGVNEAKVSVYDVMKLIENAEKFRGWLSTLNEESSILNEYHREITRESIKENLPFKALRFSFFTGAGIALDGFTTGGLATVSGIGLGALDTFLLDKLFDGWKPDQFVNQELSIFRRTSN